MTNTYALHFEFLFRTLNFAFYILHFEFNTTLIAINKIYSK